MSEQPGGRRPEQKPSPEFSPETRRLVVEFAELVDSILPDSKEFAQAEGISDRARSRMVMFTDKKVDQARDLFYRALGITSAQGYQILTDEDYF